MYTKPYISVKIKDTELSDYIDDFDFDDTIEKDNLLVLRVLPSNGNPNKALQFLKDNNIVKNADLKFQFGFLGGTMSPVHSAKISDIDTKYGQQGISVTLKCMDAGNYLKKTSDNKIFKSKTSSEIANEIADEIGLGKEIDSTDYIWDYMPMANQSYVLFLKKLASKEDDFVFYIRGGTLYFKKRDLSQPSKITYTYGDGEQVISFSPSENTSSKVKGIPQAKMPHTDPKTGKSSIPQVNQGNANNNVAMGKKMVNFDVNGNKLNTIIQKPEKATKQVTYTKPTRNVTESNNELNAKHKTSSLNSNEATLVVELNPQLDPKGLLTMKGVVERHMGNWFIRGIKHKISQSGAATSTIKLSKNATHEKSGDGISKDNPKKTNVSVGSNPSEIKTTKKVNRVNFDVNGNKQ